MQLLSARLQNLTDIVPNNEDSDWTAPVLQSGLRLADKVLAVFNEEQPRRVILVGHSQGGLLCRIAAMAICGLVHAPAEVPAAFNVWMRNNRQRAMQVSPYLRGVIMLATPNSGAFTFGQLSVGGRLLLKSMTAVANLLGVRDVAELTTDRLFRSFQHFRVPRVRYLSISGSAVNRYSKISHDDLSEIPFISRLGIHLEKPNDGVVEDCSVDLHEASLPPEIYNMEEQYEHVRVYRDCIDVSHTNIHENETIVDIIRDRIAGW
jgi:hypothetical protein